MSPPLLPEVAERAVANAGRSPRCLSTPSIPAGGRAGPPTVRIIQRYRLLRLHSRPARSRLSACSLSRSLAASLAISLFLSVPLTLSRSIPPCLYRYCIQNRTRGLQWAGARPGAGERPGSRQASRPGARARPGVDKTTTSPGPAEAGAFFLIEKPRGLYDEK